MRPIRARFIRHLKALDEDQRGATLVEFALVATLFMTLVTGMLVWGLWLWERNVIQYATLQSARCYALPNPPSGTKLCDPSSDDGASYGVLNTFALTNTTTDTFTASQGAAQSRCVTANRSSGLPASSASLIGFSTNAMQTSVCLPGP